MSYPGRVVSWIMALWDHKYSAFISSIVLPKSNVILQSESGISMKTWKEIEACSHLPARSQSSSSNLGEMTFSRKMRLQYWTDLSWELHCSCSLYMVNVKSNHNIEQCYLCWRRLGQDWFQHTCIEPIRRSCWPSLFWPSRRAIVRPSLRWARSLFPRTTLFHSCMSIHLQLHSRCFC